MNIQIVQHNELTFAVVNDLGELEAKHLKHEYGFSQLHLDDFMNRQQVPKIEVTDKYKLIVLDFPSVKVPKQDEKTKDEKVDTHQTEKKQPDDPHHLSTLTNVITTPMKFAIPDHTSKMKRILIGHVNFFLSENSVIVLHDKQTPIIDDIFAECQKTLMNRESLMSQGPEYLFYRIVDILVDSMYGPMHEIAGMIDTIDKQIVEDQHVQTIVEDISTTRRNLVVFQAMLKPAISIFKDLSEGKHPEMSEKMRYYYRSILDHIQKVKYRMDSSRELLEGIAKSHESLLTARTNEIVKILTIFTAILLPLTLLASFYGMNITGLPYAQDARGFVFILLTMGIMAVLMMIVFKLRRWI